MRLRRFHGATIAVALSAVRQALGDDALILETCEGPAGIDVLVAVRGADEDEAPQPLAIPPASGTDADNRRKALAWHGISDPLLTRLLEPDLVHAITKSVRFGDLPLEAHGKPLLVTGEPGAGKTLSIIKLATRLVLGGRSPLVISADGCKAGAIEQLAAMTQLLGLTMIVATDPQQVSRALGRRRDGAPVLIDAPGLALHQATEQAHLAELADATDAHLVLVMPAGLDPREAADLACLHGALGVGQMIATRLDIARRLGGVVEAAWRAGLTLTEAGTGPHAADGLVPLTARLIADRLERTADNPTIGSKRDHGRRAPAICVST